MAKVLSVDEALATLAEQLSQKIDWKYLKSKRCFKKVIGDVVFELNFYTSKWNVSHERVEIRCGLSMWCKKFDKTCNVHSSIGHYGFGPLSGDYYWDIVHEENIPTVVSELYEQMESTILDLCKRFEENVVEAVKYLAQPEQLHKYHIYLDFIDVYAGRSYAEAGAKAYYENLDDEIKVKFKENYESMINGGEAVNSYGKNSMINRENFKIIIENRINVEF